MNHSPISYVIGVAKLAALQGDFVGEERKRHLLACNEAKEDYLRLSDIEKASIDFVLAYEANKPYSEEYHRLKIALGIEEI